MASSTVQNNEEFQLNAQHSVNGTNPSPESNPWTSAPSTSGSRPAPPSARSYIPGNNGIRQPAAVPSANGEGGGGSQGGQSGYTILVPANVRYRGVNMQLDLKLDQKTLAAAETLSRAVQDAVAAGRGVSDSGTNGLNHEGTSTGLQVFENVVSQVPATQALFQESTGLRALDSDPDSVPDALTDSDKLSHSLLAKTGGRNPRDMLTEKLKSAVRQQKNKSGLVLPPISSQHSYSLPSSPLVAGVSTTLLHEGLQNARTLSQRPSLSSPTALTAGAFSGLDAGSGSLSGPSTPLAALPSTSSAVPVSLSSDVGEPHLTPSEMEMILNGGNPTEEAPKKPPARSGGSKKSKHPPAPFCHFSMGDKPCRQRSIVNFKFCIRHILNDPTSPYKMCAHMRKGGANKPEIQCTNAIRLDKGEEFCSTHLIAMGRLQPKKKANKDGASTPAAKKKGAVFGQEPYILLLTPPLFSPTGMPTTSQHQPNEMYHHHPQQQPPHFSANQTAPFPQWEGGYPSVPVSSGPPYASPPTPVAFPGQPIHQPGAYQHHHLNPATPQSPNFGSYNNSQGQQQQGQGPPFSGPPFHGGYHAPHALTNGYAPAYSPQTPGPGPPSAGFVYPSSSSATPFDLASHPSTPGRPGSNLSGGGPYGAPSTPGSPWKHPPPRTDLMRSHPELASKLLVGGLEENGTQSLDDSNQGPLFQGSNPYLTCGSVGNSLDPFGMLNISPTTSSSAGLLAPARAPVPAPAPHLFPSPVPSDRSVESQLSSHTATPTQPPTTSVSSGGLGASLPPLFGGTGTPFFGEAASSADYFPQGASMPAEATSSQTHQDGSLLPAPYLPPTSSAPQARGTTPSGAGAWTSHVLKSEPGQLAQLDSLVTLTGNFGGNLGGGGEMTPSVSSQQSTPVAGTKKVIRLQQKKRRCPMGGRYYRKIPTVDHMCRMMEDIDFDKHDLFPLGLEPSSSDTDGEDEGERISGGDSCFLSRLLTHSHSHSAPHKTVEMDDVWGERVVTARHQLYLLKKQLRLERTGLRRGWAEGVAVASISRRYPNTVGKAILHRNSKKKDTRTRTNPLPDKTIEHSKHGLKRCCLQSREKGRCSAVCLPYSNHCYKHILYNIDQRLFRYCSEQGCELPVLDLGMPQGVPGGALCPRHTTRKLWIAGGEGTHKRKTTKKYLLLRKHKRRKVKRETGEEEEEEEEDPTPYEELEESEDGRTSNGSSLERQGGESSAGTRHPSAAENDVSLASVAKDLGFEDHELTEMLNKFPDEAFTSIMSQDFGKNGDHCIRVEDQASVMDAMVVAAGGSGAQADIPVPPGTHSWADVEQFLLSEGYRGSSFAGEMAHFMPPPPPYPAPPGWPPQPPDSAPILPPSTPNVI